jgi:hypothetical protein
MWGNAWYGGHSAHIFVGFEDSLGENLGNESHHLWDVVGLRGRLIFH